MRLDAVGWLQPTPCSGRPLHSPPRWATQELGSCGHSTTRITYEDVVNAIACLRRIILLWPRPLMCRAPPPFLSTCVAAKFAPSFSNGTMSSVMSMSLSTQTLAATRWLWLGASVGVVARGRPVKMDRIVCERLI